MICSKTGLKAIFGILLLAVLICPSCVTEPERQKVRGGIVITGEPILPEAALDERIAALEEVLANNMVQEDDRVAVANLIADYHRIKALSKGNTTDEDLREIIMILFNDLVLADGGYLSPGIQSSSQEIYPGAVEDLNARKQDIFRKYMEKDYPAVISGYNEMEGLFGRDSINTETDILLAMSLAAEGRYPEAIDIGDSILIEMEQRPGLIDLRAGLVQWRLDTGDKDTAYKEYQKLIDDLNGREAVLNRTTESVNTQKTGASDQVLDRILNNESTPDINTRIKAMLNEIEVLKNQGDFTGARLLLLKWKLRADDPVELVGISDALESLDLSYAEYQERLKTDTGELIDQATRLIEEEDYASAINMLDMAEKTGDANAEIKGKRDLAVERLIDQERNRAAKIFLTAKKTNDIKKKKELLLSAMDILTGLIQKYPSSGMAEKIKSYLDSVNHELDKIGEN